MSEVKTNIDAIKFILIGDKKTFRKSTVYLKNDSLPNIIKYLENIKKNNKVNISKIDHILQYFNNENDIIKKTCGVKKIKDIIFHLDTIYDKDPILKKITDPVEKNITNPIIKNVDNLIVPIVKANATEIVIPVNANTVENTVLAKGTTMKYTIPVVEYTDINTFLEFADDEDIKNINFNNENNNVQALAKVQQQINDWQITDDILEKHNEIELNLDNNTTKYKFTEEHPMEYVRRNTDKKNKKVYRIRFDAEKIDNRYENLDDACNFVVDKITKNKKNTFPDLRIGGTNDGSSEKIKKTFKYADHFFITYWFDNEPYFDIQHIISILKLKEKQYSNIYNNHINDIIMYVWYKNKFGGYILRELISENTMYNIILSSKSDISNTLRKDVGNIMIKLRKLDMLKITNDSIGSYTNTKIIISKKDKNNISGEEYLIKLSNYVFMPYTWNTEGIYGIISYYTSICQKRLYMYHLHRHVLYAAILILQKAIAGNHVIIKFGYGEFYYGRVKTLQSEYKCYIHIIGVKIIEGKSDEEKFHAEMRSTYPNLIFETEIKNTEKTELYKFHPHMMKLFSEYPESTKSKPITVSNEIRDANLTEIVNLESNFIDHVNYLGLGHHFNIKSSKLDENIKENKADENIKENKVDENIKENKISETIKENKTDETVKILSKYITEQNNTIKILVDTAFIREKSTLMKEKNQKRIMELTYISDTTQTICNNNNNNLFLASILSAILPTNKTKQKSDS